MTPAASAGTGTAANALPPLSFTLDLEDHRGDGNARHLANGARLLDYFAARGIRATVFVVGELLTSAPELVRRCHADGHELALHSWTHTPLTADTPLHFRHGLADCCKRLEDLCARPVAGFRAPLFSLTPATAWALEVLVELGLRYSSSVLPGTHPLYGYAGAPATAFRWPGGLLELPVPLRRFGPLALPFLGGIYLRYLPAAVVRRWRAALPPTTVPWSYVHPYDIDTDEAYFRFPGTTAWMSWLLWRRRAGTLRSLDALLDASGGHSAAPLRDVVEHLQGTHLPTFRPLS